MTYFNTASLGILIGLGACLVTGCGEEEGGSLFGAGGRDGGAPTSDGAAGGVCTTGTSQACECEPDEQGTVRTGTQACYEGQWFDCHCNELIELGPPSLDGVCKAGRYEGDFSGIYTSGFTFIGVPIPVFALDPTGAPGLAFTLNKKEQAAGQEFNIYTISDGYVKGTADGLFPFEGALTGELDCATKTFTGTLKGGYCVTLCAGVNEAAFEGPVVGYYDSEGFQFTGGTWDLTETDGNSGAFGAYGGMGEWNAVWVGDGTVDTTTGTTVDGGAGAP